MGVVIEQRYEVEKLVCQEEGQDGVGVEEDLDLCFDLHGLVYLCAEDAFEWSGCRVAAVDRLDSTRSALCCLAI